MIDHFEIKVMKYAECKHFYTKVLLMLGIEMKWADECAAGFGLLNEEKTRFLIEASSLSTKSHIAFSAPTKQSVIQFHEIGVKNGFTCNGEPGFRQQYSPGYYAAFLLDPDGNNIEAVVYL